MSIRTSSARQIKRLAFVAALFVPPAFAQSSFVGHEYLKEASVTLDAARTIALNAFPGTIVDQELERESGGSGLRYSFDIKNGPVTQEVGVDAKTGAVLENSAEGPNAD